MVAGWGQALQAALDGDDAAARSRFDTCCVEAVRVGGSHAQRDVIELTRAAGRIPLVAGTAVFRGGAEHYAANIAALRG